MLPAASGQAARLLHDTQAMNAFKGLAMGGVAEWRNFTWSPIEHIDPWIARIWTITGSGNACAHLLRVPEGNKSGSIH